MRRNQDNDKQNTTMTRETAKDFLPIIEAFIGGKTIQFDSGRDWEDLGDDVAFNNEPILYRIKPEAVLVPMTSQDLPPVFWVRSKNPDGRFEWLAAACLPDGSFVGTCGTSIEPSRFAHYEWSPDRKTWNSFMKEVEA